MTRRSRSGRRRVWANRPYLSEDQVSEFFATVDKIRKARLAADVIAAAKPCQTSAPPQHSVISAKSLESRCQ